MTKSQKIIWIGGSAMTVLFEAITIVIRFTTHVSAVEFNKTAPLLLQIHHMFWSVPFLIAAAIGYRKPFAPWCWAISIGLVASDLVHHFVVLPILVGNTGWHWP
jgi:hypothetical protein